MLSVLEGDRVVENTERLATVITGSPNGYFAALNRLQRQLPIKIGNADGPQLRFDLDDAAVEFITRGITEDELPPTQVRTLSHEAAAEAADYHQRAMELLATVHPTLPLSVRRLVGTVLFADVANCAGGSSGDALGLVWISPLRGWSAVRYAECLCHETTHQALFLEDMLTPVFSSDSEQPLVVSSIRGTKRPYESAFHAAVVAAVVVQMYTALDMPALAAGFVDGLAKSVAEFQITPQHLTARGRELLAELAGVVTTVADIRTGHADSVRSP